jgi:hypothetical protein
MSGKDFFLSWMMRIGSRWREAAARGGAGTARKKG